MEKVKRTEKGWAGHYICADRCMFRRHTLLYYGGLAISVSTVGNFIQGRENREVTQIGSGHYFETMAFHSQMATPSAPWRDGDVSKPIMIQSPSKLYQPWKEQEANDMHEKVVDEITERLLAGDQFLIMED